MGIVKGNWLTGAHSGRACRHDDIYTKVDKKTGKCYSVKLCHPNDKNSALQAAQRNAFGMISAALSAWIKEQKALKSDAYKSLKAQYDRQSKYATLRGYMMAKDMAQVMDDKTVQISAGGNVFSVTVSGIGAGSGTGNGSPSTGSGTGSQNPNGQYTISVTSANTAQGAATGGGTFTSGSRIQITATPKPGYAFDKWSDGNTQATRELTVSQNLSLVASFMAADAGGSNPGGSEGGDHQSATPEY